MSENRRPFYSSRKWRPIYSVWLATLLGPSLILGGQMFCTRQVACAASNLSTWLVSIPSLRYLTITTISNNVFTRQILVDRTNIWPYANETMYINVAAYVTIIYYKICQITATHLLPSINAYCSVLTIDFCVIILKFIIAVLQIYYLLVLIVNEYH